MYSLPSDVITAFKKLTREFSLKVVYGDYTLTGEDIESFSLDFILNSKKIPISGGIASTKLSLSLVDFGNLPVAFVPTTPIKLYIAIKLPSDTFSSDIPLGCYYIDSNTYKKTDLGVNFDAYDYMLVLDKTMTKEDIANTNDHSCADIFNYIKLKFGLTCDSVTLSNKTLHTDISNISFRKILQRIGILSGCNFVFDMSAEKKIKAVFVPDVTIDEYDYAFTGENYDEFEVGDHYSITKITNTNNSAENTSENKTISYGDDSGYSVDYQYQYCLTTESELETMYITNKYPVSWYAYTLKSAGYVFVEVGDTISFTDRNNKPYILQVGEHKLSFNGDGLTSEISCGSLDSNVSTTSDTSTGSISSDLQSVYYNLLVTQKVLTDTITANEAKFNSLDSKYATLEALDAVNATIERIEAGTITAEELNALKSRIGALETDSANITSIIFGTAVGTTVQTEFANAVAAALGSAVIKDAMIENLSVSKINGGTISTNKFNIQSDSGNLVISDNTMQISDGTRIRVQIGKDSNDDYNLSLYDASGNLLWDAQGIKADAIRDDIITNDMVNENANIDGSKINIPSLVEEINGNTSTIKASKIYYDSSSQTLDVLFQSLSQTVTDLGNNVTTLQSDYSVMNGKLTSVINESSETKTALEELELGGVQLIDNSTNFPPNPTKYGTYTIEVVDDDTTISGKAKVFTATGSGGGFYDKSFVYEVGKTYTISFKFKMNYVKNNSFSIGIEGKDNVRQENYLTADTWVNVTQTFVAHESNLSFVVYPNFVAGNVITIADVMLVYGDKAFTWTPSTNDTQQQITELSTKHSSLEQTVDGFITDVSENYATNNSIEILQSSIEQNAEEVELSFSRATTYTDEALSGVQDTLEDYNAYIRFSTDGMEIGKEGSDFKTKLNDTELGFYDGDNKAAYINNNSLYVPQKIEVQGTMTVSNPVDNYFFDWKVRSNGHLSLVWRGEDN